MNRRIWSGRLAIGVAATACVVVAACAEKVAAPRVVGSPRFNLQVTTTAPRSAAAQKLFVVAAYFSSVLDAERDSIRLLDTATVAITGGAQQVTLKVDLTTCLADVTRRGSRDACSLYVAGFLVPAAVIVDTADLTGAAYDYQIMGPFDASPGHPPTVPAIDLSTSHFAVNHWESDDALQLGGEQGPQFFTGPITGFGSGSASTTPTLFALTQGQVAAGTATTAPVFGAVLGVLQNGVWRRVSGPSGAQFNDVAAFSPTDVYLAGSAGLYHYDGASITPVSSVREGLRSVAVTGAGASAKVLVAGTSSGGVWVSNLTTFTKYSTGTSQVIDGVCVNSASEAFASSRSGTGLFRFDGTAWTSVPSSFTSAKLDLQCTGTGAYVGAQGSPGTLLRWSGSGWTTVAGPPTAVGRTLSWAVTSANEMYAVGDSAAVNRAFYRFDGTAWREIGRRGFTGGVQVRPWADPRGGAAYVASSNFGATRVEAVTATTTSVVSSQPSLRDVSMPSSGSAFAVGANFFLARWDGSRWNVDAPPSGTPTNITLNGVWSDAPNNAWAVGQQSAIVRWDGSRWSVISDSRRPIVSSVDNYNAVWSAGGTVWAVGDVSILRCRSTTSCSTDPGTGSGALYGVWAASPTNAYAAGAGGRIVHFDGTSWTPMASSTTARLSRVWGSGPSDVWAAGDTALVHYDGTSWKNMSQGVDGQVFSGYVSPPIFQTGVWGTTAKDLYVTTWFGRILRGYGSFWGDVPGPFDNASIAHVAGIAGPPNGCPIAVTDGQSGTGGPLLLRGVGPNGCLGSGMTPPASWP